MNYEKIMFLTILLVAVIILVGCAKPENQEIPVRIVKESVPTLEIRPVPAELLRTPIPMNQIPVFAAPLSAGTSSCLTADGEAKLRMLMIDRESHLGAWEKWAILH